MRLRWATILATIVCGIQIIFVYIVCNWALSYSVLQFLKMVNPL